MTVDGAGARWAAIVLTLVTLVSGCSVAALATRNPLPGDDALADRLVSGVSSEGANPHLLALQRIADAAGGNRATGGPGYEASVDYVVGALTAAGYQVQTPTYPASADRRRDRGEPDASRRNGPFRNVVTQTRTGDPGRVVLLGAHLDSVRDGPGINDNGTGVAALLEIAQKLGNSPAVRNMVRFAFWGSEEVGFDGSTHYVRTLADQERRNLMMYLNLDMLGSPNGGYFVQGGKGNRAARTGPPGSERIAQVLIDRFESEGVTAEVSPFYDEGSDYGPFLKAGVPSGGLYAGDEEEKTEEQAENWGGEAGEVYDPCYHRACDRIENVDLVTLDRYIDAVAGTVAHFATSEQRLIG